MLTLSVSDLKLYLICPQKFHYQFVALRGHEKRSEALDLGTAMHEAIAAKAKGEDVEKAVRSWRDDMVEQYPELTDYFDGVVGKYLVYQSALLEWQPYAGEEVLAVEQELRLPLFPGVELVGRLDTVTRWNGKLWHRQRKTIDPTKSRPTFAECQRTDWHETVYHWMIDAHYGKCAGTILDMFLKNTKKAMAEGAPLVETWTMPREEGIEERTRADITRVAGAILNEVQQPDIWLPIRNRASCGGMFGNSLCPYKGVCDGNIPISDSQFTDLEPRYRRDVG